MFEDVEKVSVELTADERRMLVAGLNDWGGPAYGTEAVAVAMGFLSLDDLDAGEGERILDDIQTGRALSIRDWTRALVATEIAFASDVIGTGSEWSSIQDGTDDFWIAVLRRLQQKVPYHRESLQ